MKEIVIVSGKGGTGKTSLVASLAALFHEAPAHGQLDTVLVDCDVDAADLHLVLAPRVLRREPFQGGQEAVIGPAACSGCGLCEQLCRFEAILTDGGGFRVDPLACEGCGVCVRFCPARAIDFPRRVCGEWQVSETRLGPLVHARLDAAAENSGKLVTQVRREARRLAREQWRELLLVDGLPGIGCPVIASVTGASLVLLVTEPTPSGEHDLERVLALANQLKVPAALCINRWDLHPELAARIEEQAAARGAHCLGRIAYDPAVTAAQVQGLSVVELQRLQGTDSPAARDITRVWQALQQRFLQ